MPRVNRHKARYRARKLKAVQPLSKGAPNRKIIASHTSGNSEYYLHATKGYRYVTIVAARNELLESLIDGTGL